MFTRSHPLFNRDAQMQPTIDNKCLFVDYWPQTAPTASASEFQWQRRFLTSVNDVHLVAYREDRGEAVSTYLAQVAGFMTGEQLLGLLLRTDISSTHMDFQSGAQVQLFTTDPGSVPTAYAGGGSDARVPTYEALFVELNGRRINYVDGFNVFGQVRYSTIQALQKYGAESSWMFQVDHVVWHALYHVTTLNFEFWKNSPEGVDFYMDGVDGDQVTFTV